MKKILLVEDNPFIVDIYRNYLEKEGYEVAVAMNKETALEKIKNSYPDLLVLDLNLDINFPGPKDGLDILKIVRQDPKTKGLKVVVISNYDPKNCLELLELPNLGVIKFFLKAESVPEEIINSVKEILK